MNKISPVKFVIFLFIPLIFLLLTAEIICRVKFFIMHAKDWNYIVTPFRIQDIEMMDHGATFIPPDEDKQENEQQIVIKWHKPCRDREVYSNYYKKLMPYTYDRYCFRGDRIDLKKIPSEFRIFVVGGSTVEDGECDEEMMTTQLKHLLPTKHKNKDVKIVNAGHAWYGSSRILSLYQNKVYKFHPDLVLYYEAWNEQTTHAWWFDVNARIGKLENNKMHRLLHYKSMLYTYLVEKYYFKTTKQRRFWVIDLAKLENNLIALYENVKKNGAQFIFITQPINVPRFFNGVDTFNYQDVLQRLNELKNNSDYKYDASEISALNQRLAVFYSIKICNLHSIPYINILDEIEALDKLQRDELFIDLPHRTSKGNRIVGQLITSKLRAMLEKDKLR